MELIADAYLVTLALLGLYGSHRLWMICRFRWTSGTARASTGALEGVGTAAERPAASVAPFVTVQLPLYNERTVAARLLRAVGALDYPAQRFQIQVLDDSSDETGAIVDHEAALLRRSGLQVSVLRRDNRVGFKAGALDHGMARAQGELLCIFDADFVPEPDFLRRLVPHFDDPRVGMVQARWEHKNRDESTLTRAQSTLLDGHFVIEHTVRHRGGLFFNFNGTAGIWRRAAIEEAGGWQHDTLTEDLDLSYRAQLGGWRFVYLPLVTAPAEVPPDISAFKSQQHRWAKGSVQVARKLSRRILSADVPWRVKREALLHLTGNTGYPLVMLLAVLLPLSIRDNTRFGAWWHLGMFVLCTLSVVVFYDTSQRVLGRRIRARLRDVPAAMSLGIGMCVSQTRAVLEGLLPRTGEFVRTPKRGDAPRSARYRAMLRGLPGAELAFAAWFAVALVEAVRRGMWGSLPFLLLFFSGFVWVGVLSLKDWSAARAARAAWTIPAARPPSATLTPEVGGPRAAGFVGSRQPGASVTAEATGRLYSAWIVNPPEERSSTR